MIVKLIDTSVPKVKQLLMVITPLETVTAVDGTRMVDVPETFDGVKRKVSTIEPENEAAPVGSLYENEMLYKLPRDPSECVQPFSPASVAARFEMLGAPLPPVTVYVTVMFCGLFDATVD